MAKARRCEFCSAPLPKDARPNRKFCGDDCRKGRLPKPAAAELDVEVGAVLAATETAIAAAEKEKRLTAFDAGALATIRVLARKIDEEQDRWDYCLSWNDEQPEGSRPKPPAMDNVSIPTYLRYCESLGLTPAGRGRIPGASKGGTGGNRLGSHLAAVRKPQAG